MDLQRIAEEKLAQMGYEAPDANNNSGRPLYHSDQTAYRDDVAATHTDPYAKIDAKVEGRKVQDCPTCQGPALYACECEYGEMMCGKGHYWYMTKTGRIIAADPHETN